MNQAQDAHNDAKDIAIVPLLASLHLRYPNYNALSLRDYVAAFAPEAVVLSSLEPNSLEKPSWQDTPEIVLPMSIVPWAQQQGLPLLPILIPSPDPQASYDFRRYLGQYSQQRRALMEVDQLLQPVQELLGQALTLARIDSELLPLLEDYQQQREARFEDGPASDWLRERMQAMAKTVLELPYRRVALLASIDHIPFLQAALRSQATLVRLPKLEPSEAVRQRALLDFAFLGELPEPGNVLAQLRKLDSSEARFHEANILLSHGHIAEAYEVLEQTSQGDFSQPYFLPSYLLSRLGQVRDLMGKRDAALRAYRAVRALDWAAAEALEAANTGLQQPFEGLSRKAV